MARIYCIQEHLIQVQVGYIVSLDREESHHLVNVLRVKKGDNIKIMNGQGMVCDCEVSVLDKKEVKARVCAVKIYEKPKLTVRLIQCLPKNKVLEEVVRKATELGANQIVLITGQHSQGQLEIKLERLKTIILEGCKQSGNPFIPNIIQEKNVESYLKHNLPKDKNLHVVASLEEGAKTIRKCYESIDEKKPDNIHCWVGPEGDFSKEEYRQLKEAGVIGVRLGSYVLRVETAAVSLLANIINAS